MECLDERQISSQRPCVLCLIPFNSTDASEGGLSFNRPFVSQEPVSEKQLRNHTKIETLVNTYSICGKDNESMNLFGKITSKRY